MMCQTPAVDAGAGGDHHGLGHHPPVDPGRAVGGVHEHGRDGALGQAAVAEHANLHVQVGAAV
jgi:hypothetical protein